MSKKLFNKLLTSKTLTCDVTVLIGDYPYFACYSKRAWEDGAYIATWCATPEYDFVIYVPENASWDEKIWGTLHELGHYFTRNSGNPTLKDECLAWAYAERHMGELGYDIPDEYYEYKVNHLATYRTKDL